MEESDFLSIPWIRLWTRGKYPSGCVRGKRGRRLHLPDQGRCQQRADAYDVQSEYLVGKVIWSSLILGKISRLAANPLIFIPVILLPLSVILLTNLIHTVRLAKKITREEEEAAVREAVEELRKRKNQEKPLE